MLPLIRDTTWESRNRPRLERGCECCPCSCTNILFYSHYPSNIIIFHLEVGLAQWFSKCGFWINSISTTRELVPLQTFESYISSQLSEISSESSRESWTSVYSDMKCSIMIEMTEEVNKIKLKQTKRHSEITTNETTTKAYRIIYPAMPTAQYDTLCVYWMSVYSYLWQKNDHSSWLKQKWIYSVNKYFLHCARHRGHTIKIQVISPLHQILCRNKKIIWEADSGTFFGCLCYQKIKKIKKIILLIVYTLQVESLSYQRERFDPLWWNFLSLTVCAWRQLSLGHSKERHTVAPEAQQLRQQPRQQPAPLTQTWRWSWSMGRSWENGEQNTGNGQNGYSFPLLWSFIFHFCDSQYIVETFPRFTINPDYLPPLSMDFFFLVSWKLLEEED